MRSPGIAWTWTVPDIGDDGTNPTSAENPKTMKLPIKLNATWSNSIVVDWGDGAVTTHTEGMYNTPANQHQYTSGGSKQVKVTSATGKMPQFMFGCRYYTGAADDQETATERNAITSIDHYHAVQYANGSRSAWFSFNNCTNLERVDIRCFVQRTSCYVASGGRDNGLFFNTKISKIKKETLQHLVNQTNFEGVLRNTKITSIPAGIFANNRAVTTFYYAFDSCSDLTCSIPADLFKYNTAVTTFLSCFSGCSNLTGSIPADLFRYNTAVTTFRSCFSGCSNLTGSIPADLFRYNTAVTIFLSCFSGCSNLTGSIPADLFRYNTNATNFELTFMECRNLDGTAPALWDTTQYPNITSHAGCFASCNKLSNYADIPDGWK